MADTASSTVTPLAEIVGQVNPDPGAASHAVATSMDTIFSWEYELAGSDVAALYTKAKGAQWDADELPWDTVVDQERLVHAQAAFVGGFTAGADLTGSSFEHWGDREWLHLGVETQNWMLSNLLHCEQGALLAAAKVVESAPRLDVKYFGATQVVDEARHVEVFARYLEEKLSGHYPVNLHVRGVLDEFLGDPRWDVTYLGAQVLLEGMALATLEVAGQIVHEPLLDLVLRKVMADEARHTAFAASSLNPLYESMTAGEIAERQELAFDATMRLRDRFAMQEVWERFDVPVSEATRLLVQRPERQMFQQLLQVRVVPNCARVGLLDAGDGWLRARFAEVGLVAAAPGSSGDGS